MVDIEVEDGSKGVVVGSFEEDEAGVRFENRACVKFEDGTEDDSRHWVVGSCGWKGKSSKGGRR